MDYVLKPFSGSEAAELPTIMSRAIEGVEILLQSDIVRAMNVVNGVPKSPEPVTAPPPESPR
jgi:hypothetical protein